MVIWWWLWLSGFGGVDVEEGEELGLQPSGVRDFGWLLVVGGDEAEVVEGLQDEAAGGSGGTVVEAVEPDHVGVALLGEAGADFSFDEAEDEQGEADDGDEGGDPPVVLQEHGCDREGSFDRGVALFHDGLAFVAAQDFGGSASAGGRLDSRAYQPSVAVSASMASWS
jgi:hypothetical protein